MPARVLLQDFTGVPAVVDLAAMRDGIVRLGGDPRKVNPLQPVELVIDHSVQVDHYRRAQRRRPERRARVLAQQGALHVPPLGPGRVRQLPVVPPDTGIVHQVNLEYLARVVFSEQSGGGRARLPGHARRHRLAHDDGQRARRRRLGRRRHRGRGRDARPADLDADSGSRRLPADRSAARRRDRDRPRAHDHRAPAQARRRRQVRRVLRPGPRVPDDCRSRDARQHVAGVRRDDRDLPDRRHDARLPAADRRATKRTCSWSRPTRRSRACSARPTRRIRSTRRRSSSICRPSSRASPGPKRPQDRVSLQPVEAEVPAGARGHARRAQAEAGGREAGRNDGSPASQP